MTFTREQLASQAADLAIQGVFIGTSSWKYPGWAGQIYDPTRYEYRGKFAQTRFNRDCLAEYAEVFKTACVDAAYYNFRSKQYLEGMVDQTPDGFLFAFKVTDVITIKKFANLPRFGDLAGNFNPNYLNAEPFAKAFLGPCEPFRQNTGLLMFEFSSGRALIAEGQAVGPKRKTFVFVNNRLDGNAISTIAAMMSGGS